jgi:hypothetical protein
MAALNDRLKLKRATDWLQATQEQLLKPGKLSRLNKLSIHSISKSSKLNLHCTEERYASERAARFTERICRPEECIWKC